MKRTSKVILIVAACLLGTLAGLTTASSQVVLCRFIPGAGLGIQDMTNCYDAGDCGFSQCCLRYECVGHPGLCGANCGQVCTLTVTCETLSYACYADCTGQ
jgi:hypothetical protein